ncbi:MAG TPA: hypothetical protein VN788_16235 [Verrucomicrobiae bacterium]|jgi:hypothetical protein|nr:hypothetical protein [Verrucomicrobiae bacterium]
MSFRNSPLELLESERGKTPRELAFQLSCNRRDFLRTAAGLTVGGALLGHSPFMQAALLPKKKKTVVITFGGGARDQETFAPEGQENIPHLMRELIPQSSFFTQVVNRGILGHYVATASLATGVYETFNNFAAVPPEYPTIFEYFRKDLKRPASDAWVVAPSNGFNRIGESSYRSYGQGLGASVILPKHLLAAAMEGRVGDLEPLVRDNYETPYYAPEIRGREFELQQLESILKLSVDDFKAHARTLASPDELSVYIARQLMRQIAPSLLWITMHDIDIAHAGTYSLYVDGIRRTDRLCAEIWKTIQTEPEYAGNTTLFILPDFGRDADEDSGGNGFQHHRTGDALSRTTWMLALGAGVREGVVYDRRVDSTDLVPTVGAMMGFTPALCQGKPVSELL